VGEEGTAQLIRSPIVKRGKSSSHSLEGLLPVPPQPSTAPQHTSLSFLSIENASLRKQTDFLKDQLKVYQKTISELSSKYEGARAEALEMEEKVTKTLVENRKIVEENEQLIQMLRFLETDQPSKGFLQEALEAKILSIDQDRDEKIERYRRVLTKYISTLQEFLASQEWAVALVSSPYPKKELIDCEENIKSQIERLHAEIVYYQSQLNNERGLEKSYCTSISSSIMQSPGFSPTKTLRFTAAQEIMSPIHPNGL
jgi:chromosome segregation ATPase